MSLFKLNLFPHTLYLNKMFKPNICTQITFLTNSISISIFHSQPAFVASTLPLVLLVSHRHTMRTVLQGIIIYIILHTMPGRDDRKSSQHNALVVGRRNTAEIIMHSSYARAEQTHRQFSTNSMHRGDDGWQPWHHIQPL